MTTTYTYSLASDFGGSMSSSQLHREITDDVSITKSLSAVSAYGDVVKIVFTSALSAGEITELETLIASHSVVPVASYTSEMTLVLEKHRHRKSSYRKLGTCIYAGSLRVGPIKQVKCISSMDSKNTDYTVKILDATSNKTIVETTLTNTTETLNDLTPLANIPTEESLIYVLLKVTGKRDAYIENVTLYI